MNTARRAAAVLLALALACGPVLAEDYSFFDSDDELIIEESFGDVAWDFPIPLYDMDPDLIILANAEFFLSPDFVPEPLVTMKTRRANRDGSNANGGVLKASGGTMQLQAECAEALVALSEAARADGFYLYLKSAYRSWGTQDGMYSRRMRRNHGVDDGWVAMPGASDHQTGLGCDVIPRSWINASGMNSRMAREPECVWMAQHCHEYGFIIRYPEGKEEATGINYEPWHLRYVAIPVATYIMQNGLCLEEFHVLLQAAIDRFIAAGGNPSVVEPYIQRSAGYQGSWH